MIKKVIDFNRLPKQEYMEPTVTVVQLQHRQHILAESYTGIQSKNSTDDDNPDYDGNSWGSIWDAN
jgi:hypothetical protein